MDLLKQMILMLLLCCLSFGLHAQQEIVSTGAEATGIGGSASYTVGQVAYTTNTATNGTVAQGVQQPYGIFEVTGMSETGIALRMSVYPNPTANYLLLEITASVMTKQLMYQLYDINGKLLHKEENIASKTQIKMTDYKQGAYYLNIIESNKKIKTFKIVKN